MGINALKGGKKGGGKGWGKDNGGKNNNVINPKGGSRVKGRRAKEEEAREQVVPDPLCWTLLRVRSLWTSRFRVSQKNSLE